MERFEACWLTEEGTRYTIGLVPQPEDVVHVKAVEDGMAMLAVTRGDMSISLGKHKQEDAMRLWRTFMAQVEEANPGRRIE